MTGKTDFYLVVISLQVHDDVFSLILFFLTSEGFKHWTIDTNTGDKFIVQAEVPPGVESLTNTGHPGM